MLPACRSLSSSATRLSALPSSLATVQLDAAFACCRPQRFSAGRCCLPVAPADIGFLGELQPAVLGEPAAGVSGISRHRPPPSCTRPRRVPARAAAGGAFTAVGIPPAAPTGFGSLPLSTSTNSRSISSTSAPRRSRLAAVVGPLPRSPSGSGRAPSGCHSSVCGAAPRSRLSGRISTVRRSGLLLDEQDGHQGDQADDCGDQEDLRRGVTVRGAHDFADRLRQVHQVHAGPGRPPGTGMPAAASPSWRAG